MHSRKGRPRVKPVIEGPFNEWIRQAMRLKNIRREEDFADEFGIGRTTLKSLMYGRQSLAGTWVKPSLDTLTKLSVAIDRPLIELLERLYEHEDVFIQARAPLVGFVGAGPGEAEELNEQVILDPSRAKGGDFISYKVRGNSMCGGRRPICDGDIIVVDRLQKFRPNWEVVARLQDDTYVCKLYKEDPSGAYLVSTNPNETNGTPTVIPADQVAELVGIVTEIRRRLSTA